MEYNLEHYIITFKHFNQHTLLPYKINIFQVIRNYLKAKFICELYELFYQ